MKLVSLTENRLVRKRNVRWCYFIGISLTENVYTYQQPFDIPT